MRVPRSLRLMLTKGEVLPIPAGYRRLRVRSGRAWVTVSGADLTLGRGQEIGLDAKGDQAVLSTLGGLPAVVELLPTSREADWRRSARHPGVAA